MAVSVGESAALPLGAHGHVCMHSCRWMCLRMCTCVMFAFYPARKSARQPASQAASQAAREPGSQPGRQAATQSGTQTASQAGRMVDCFLPFCHGFRHIYLFLTISCCVFVCFRGGFISVDFVFVF